MSPRVSSRLAAQKTSDRISDKENSPNQISSPPATSAPLKQKAAAKKKAAPRKQSSATDDKPKLNGSHGSPKDDTKPAPVAKQTGKTGKNGKDASTEKAIPSANKGTKRKRSSPAPKVEEADDDELPHNMGRRVPAMANVKKEDAADVQPAPRKSRTAPKSVKQEEIVTDAKELIDDTKQPPKKRAKKAHPYGLTPGETPFPDWPHPTKDECQIVHDLLLGTIPPERRKKFFPPDDIPPPSEVVAGCGEVPSILDALIRTLLSAATNGQNSSNAFQGLVKRFGLATDGLGKGSVNWNAVHEASHEEVFDAIKCGGLAKNKSKNIKKLLAMVHQENQERLAALLKAQEAGSPDNADEEEKAERALELRALEKGILTLDYYHHLEKNAALSTFTHYPGIGVKTAACVNLFCMQRPCFAVDTHVFRLCQYLGWVPPEDSRGEKQKKVDRNTTFSHCEVMVPDELKYGLHQLFLEHGKHCPRCRAVTGEKSEGWKDANCVIEHLVKRLGAKKGGFDSPKKIAKGKKGKNVAGEEDEESGSELSDLPSEGEGDKATTPKKPTKQAAATKPKRVTKAKAITTPAKKPSTPKSKTPNGKKKAEADVESEEEAEDEEMSDLTDAPESSANEEED